MEIKRYKPQCDPDDIFGSHPYMGLSKDGEWLRYEDVAPLIAELETLKAKTKIYPIDECPEEWKDGRWVLGIWDKSAWQPESLRWIGIAWFNAQGEQFVTPTHVTALPEVGE